MYTFDLIRVHKFECQYITQPCPVSKLNLGNCDWLGISSSMTSHLRQAHYKSGICLDYQGLVFVAVVILFRSAVSVPLEIIVNLYSRTMSYSTAALK
jgi:hypothetical protein